MGGVNADFLGDYISLLVLAAGGVGLGTLGLLSVVSPRHRGLRWLVPVLAVLLTLLALTGPFLGQPRSLSVVSGILAAIAGLFELSRGSWLRRLCSRVQALLLNPSLQWGSLLALTVTLTVGWANLADRVLQPAELDLGSLPLDSPVLRELPGSHAVTDLGHPVPLYSNQQEAVQTQDGRSGEDVYLQQSNAWHYRLLRTAPPDPAYNCHGWVFAGGHGWVQSQSVELILKDNAYQEVARPQARDVAIFRDGSGQLLHSGIVHSVSPDGVVLVESKWGILGRFIHRPEDQCYAEQCTFYHSTRHGHLLRDPAESGTQHIESSQPLTTD